jgi:arylsulfatase A-like enzyme
MKWTLWICATMLLTRGAICRANAVEEESREPSRPNVLLLLTDQQTMRAMSVYGNHYLHTPYMDSLARTGVRFSISYCAAPVCGPARSSLITGRMPHETGVNFNGDVPDPAIPNVGEIFRRAGYETAWAGKWHLPASYPRAPRSAESRQTEPTSGASVPAVGPSSPPAREKCLSGE